MARPPPDSSLMPKQSRACSVFVTQPSPDRYLSSTPVGTVPGFFENQITAYITKHAAAPA